MQECTQPKRTRAGFKSVLARKRNELSESLEVGADVDCVKNKVSELNQALKTSRELMSCTRRVLLTSVISRKLMSIFTPSIMLLVV